MAKGPPKGTPKTPGSGRKPGTPNKVPSAAVVKETFIEACRRLNFDPLAKLAAIIDQLEPADQARTLLQILPYLHAQVKQAEAPTSPLAAFASVDKTVLLRAVGAESSAQEDA